MKTLITRLTPYISQNEIVGLDLVLRLSSFISSSAWNRARPPVPAEGVSRGRPLGVPSCIFFNFSSRFSFARSVVSERDDDEQVDR